MLEPYLVDTCQEIQITRNEFADRVATLGSDIPCRFREITTERTGTHQDITDADAMIWFSPSQAVEVGKIYLFQGVTYEITRVTPAKRLGETQVQFIKCDVKITQVDFDLS